MMKKTIILTVSLLLLNGSMAYAQSDDGHHTGKHLHGKMGHNPCSMLPAQGMKENTLLKNKVIDGYDVSFHVMRAPEGKGHGGSHHMMIKVEKDGKIISLQAVNSKITHPNGKSESKMMMKMGDWYMAGYDLDHKGQHQLMILFKTSDGSKHFGDIYYPGDTPENQHEHKKGDVHEQHH